MEAFMVEVDRKSAPRERWIRPTNGADMQWSNLYTEPDSTKPLIHVREVKPPAPESPAPTPDIAASIATIESSRKTHVDWCTWFEAHPEEEAKHAKTVHSAAEQREIVAAYDNVLACLRKQDEAERRAAEPATQQITVIAAKLQPSQIDTLVAVKKWFNRIVDRAPELPASFMDNTDPTPLAKKFSQLIKDLTP